VATAPSGWKKSAAVVTGSAAAHSGKADSKVAINEVEAKTLFLIM
jgi:hypothetical protein